MYHTWMRFFTPGPAHHRLGLVCLGVGLQYGALPTVGPRTLDHHVAVVISTGNGWYRAPDGRRTTVTAPALLWLTPGIPHHYGARPRRRLGRGLRRLHRARHRHLHRTRLHRTRPAPSSPSPTPPAPAPSSAASPAPPAATTPSWRSRPAPPSTNSSSPCAAPAPTLAPDGDPVLNALARDAFQPLSVADHAARHGMTTAELRTAVRRGAGCSPKDYLLGIRLGRAKELLAATELPVAAVARRVGYDDPAYFSRLFTRRVGMAPVRFRAQQGRVVPGGWSNQVPDPDDPPMIEHAPAP